jgi:hypothetical protein
MALVYPVSRVQTALQTTRATNAAAINPGLSSFHAIAEVLGKIQHKFELSFRMQLRCLLSAA